MDEKVILSLEDGYAGKRYVEIMDSCPENTSGSIPYLWFQFVEGCGYTDYRMTPDEADKVADMLKTAAERIRKAWGVKS